MSELTPEQVEARRRIERAILNGITMPDPATATRPDVQKACAEVERKMHEYHFPVEDRARAITRVQQSYEPIMQRRRAAQAADLRARVARREGNR